MPRKYNPEDDEPRYNPGSWKTPEDLWQIPDADVAKGRIVAAYHHYKEVVFQPEPTHVWIHPLDAQKWFGLPVPRIFYDLELVQDHTVKRGCFILGVTHRAEAW